MGCFCRQVSSAAFSFHLSGSNCTSEVFVSAGHVGPERGSPRGAEVAAPVRPRGDRVGRGTTATSCSAQQPWRWPRCCHAVNEKEGISESPRGWGSRRKPGRARGYSAERRGPWLRRHCHPRCGVRRDGLSAPPPPPPTISGSMSPPTVVGVLGSKTRLPRPRAVRGRWSVCPSCSAAGGPSPWGASAGRTRGPRERPV